MRLKHLLDKAITQAKDIEDLQTRLQAQGIRILLRENEMGSIYGATFIDNATRTVFNGSSLGKSYGAKAFMERVGIDSQSLWDIALSDEHEDPQRKKRKKKRLQQE